MTAKFYDTRVRLQKHEDETGAYKPNNYRFMVNAENANQAKEAITKLMKNTVKRDLDLDEYSLKITKCNYIKIHGAIDAKQVLNNN